MRFTQGFEKVSGHKLEHIARKIVPGYAKGAVEKAKDKHLITRIFDEHKKPGAGLTALNRLERFAHKKGLS